MRFDIVYTASYRYPEPVSDSINALRVKPAVTPGQSVESFHVKVEPEARIHERRDYFGTDVLEFEISEPHERLDIVARADVLTQGTAVPEETSWDAIRTDAYRRAAGEFLLIDADATPPAERLGDLPDAVRGDSPRTSVLAITEVIPQRFEYRQGTTFVGSTIADLLEGGAGVCQDFVHLGLLLLRQQGIGARYVSGYLFAAPTDGGKDSVEVDTHAWIEALLPNPEGEPRWVACDPTNGGIADEAHVKIGHGRSYQDVPPIRGVYRGPEATEVDVSVKMSRANGAG